MRLRTILFDLGNVLFDFSHERMCQQIATAFQTSSIRVRELLFENSYALAFERGQVTESQFHRHLNAEFDSQCSLEDLRTAAGNIFTPKPEMKRIVQQLRQQGLRLVLLSNTCSTHINWIRQHDDLLKSFDDWVLSYEVGACKPELRIYQAALTKIQCLPAECLYIDDIAEYVATARQLGINAVQFVGEEQFRTDLKQHGVLL